MSLVTLKQALDEAQKGQFAVGAFNFNNMEQLQGVMEAFQNTNSFGIIQASRGALTYTNDNFLHHLALAANELYPDVPFVLHLDHGDSLETIKRVIALDFTSVMIDGSAFPFEENIALTKKVVEYAHPRGVSVEGELGTLAGVEEDVVGEIVFTDPDQAEEFVEKTGVDALAIAVGTSHGAYKFSGEPMLRQDLVKEIHRRIPDCALVLHGASSVPSSLLEKVDQYGGSMKKAKGVPIVMEQEAIDNGIRKINVDTDVRLAVTATIRKFLVDQPSVFDPRKYLGASRETIASIVGEKIKAFYGENRVPKNFKPISLEEQAAIYQKG